MKRSRKTIFLIILAIILAATVLLTACGQAPSNADTQATAANPGSPPGTNDQNSIYGNVTAINGNSITLALGTFNQAERPSGQRPQGSSSPDASAGNWQNGGGQRPSMLTLSGETKTITITDESVISKPGFNRQDGQNNQNGPQNNAQNQGSNGQPPEFSNQPASLSDIQVGTTLRVVYASDNQTIESIVIMNGFGRGNFDGAQNNGNASAQISSPSNT